MQARTREHIIRRVERRFGFYTHLAIYLIVNISLILLNLLRSPAMAWSLGPLLGWGVGLLFHALSVFLDGPREAWKQRMIENELKKMQ